MVATRIPISIAVVILSLATAGNALDCFVCENCSNVTNIKASTCVEDETTVQTTISTAATTISTAATTVSTVSTIELTTLTVPTTELTTLSTEQDLMPNSTSSETSTEFSETASTSEEPAAPDAPHVLRQRRAAAEESPFQCVKTVYKDGESNRIDRGCQLKIKDEKDKASCARMIGIDEDKVSGCGVCATDSCNSANLLQISFPLLVLFLFFITRSFF